MTAETPASAPAATTQPATLLLVDGSSYLYRAFFAGGEAMSTTLPDGTEQKTGAIQIGRASGRERV